jgi:hypothetical protein
MFHPNRAALSDRSDHGGENDQIACCCFDHHIRRKLGPGYAARPAPAIRPFDHASRFLVRPGPDEGQRHMRGKNDDPSDPPSNTSVCAMAWERLRYVLGALLQRTLTTSRRLRAYSVMDGEPGRQLGRQRREDSSRARSAHDAVDQKAVSSAAPFCQASLAPRSV